MGFVGTSDEEDTARLAVEAMDNSGTQIAAECRQSSEPMQQSVGERASRMAGSRMYDHAGGLVHSDYVLVLVKNFEWKLFGFRFEGRRSAGATETISRPRSM